VHEIVKLANRPNIGLCLDTFQTFGSEYADPRTESGLIETQGITSHQLEHNFKASLQKLTKEVDPAKIYALQISDAYIPPAPLQGDEDRKEGGLRARGKWSHDFRPYPFNGGAFSSQVVEMVKAVLRTGVEKGLGLVWRFLMAGRGGRERVLIWRVFVWARWRIIKGCWVSVLVIVRFCSI
jgi:hypothetical protein